MSKRYNNEIVKITNEQNQLNGLLRRVRSSLTYLQSSGVNVAQVESRLRGFENELGYAIKHTLSALNNE